MKARELLEYIDQGDIVPLFVVTSQEIQRRRKRMEILRKDMEEALRDQRHCPKCFHPFNAEVLPEVSMGAVACPKCKHSVSQQESLEGPGRPFAKGDRLMIRAFQLTPGERRGQYHARPLSYPSFYGTAMQEGFSGPGFHVYSVMKDDGEEVDVYEKSISVLPS